MRWVRTGHVHGYNFLWLRKTECTLSADTNSSRHILYESISFTVLRQGLRWHEVGEKVYIARTWQPSVECRKCEL